MLPATPVIKDTNVSDPCTGRGVGGFGIFGVGGCVFVFRVGLEVGFFF